MIELLCLLINVNYMQIKVKIKSAHQSDQVSSKKIGLKHSTHQHQSGSVVMRKDRNLSDFFKNFLGELSL